MLEYRCPVCGRLLGKGELKDGYLEIKCDKCGLVVKISEGVGEVC